MSKDLSRKLSKNLPANLSGWDVAISVAEAEVKKAKKRVAELKRTIRTFTEFRDGGVPFPGEDTFEATCQVLGQDDLLRQSRIDVYPVYT